MNGILRAYVEELGGMCLLAADTFRSSLRPPFEFRAWMEQLFQVGVSFV